MKRVPAFLLLMLPFIGQVRALSVELIVTSDDYCFSEPDHIPTGVLEATVTDGTGPFQYDWYDVSFGMVLMCEDCGPTLGGLEGMRTYKVVVTDALASTAETTGGVMAAVGVQFQNVYTLAYEAGTSPVVIASLMNDFPNAPTDAPEVSTDPQPLFTYGPWPEWQSMYKMVLPVGTSAGTITATVQSPLGGYCTAQTNFSVALPTVLPDMDLVELVGSCSTAGTGSATVLFANGEINSQLSIVVKDAAGNMVSFPGEYSVGELPYVGIFDQLGPGSYWLVMTGDLLVSPTQIAGFTYTCRDSIQFTIADLGPTCGVVAGTVFLDDNEDCTKQSSEPGIPGTVLEVLPGPYYATTSTTGGYDLVLPIGSYTIREQGAVVDEHCIEAPIPFTITGGPATAVVDHATLSLVPLDVEVYLGSGAARPGFELTYGISIRNLTVTNTDAVTVTMQLDPVLSFLNASPAPTTVAGQTLTWVLPALPVFQERHITVHAQVPANVNLIGTDLTSTATVSTVVTDGNLTNNTATNVRTVTGSYDPNDKLAITSLGSTTQYHTVDDTWIDYTIRFQNTGTDTAFHVWISDTLAATLDAATLRIGATSHPFTWELEDQGVLKFRFSYILLPDSNVNEPRSHGFVSFRIQPRLPLLPGEIIANTANIFFDFNPPVITDPSVLVATITTAQSETVARAELLLFPDPADDRLVVLLGEDRTGDVLRIRALDGRLVRTGRVEGMRTVLDVAALPPGIYIIEIMDRSSTGMFSRFVKE